MIIHKTNKLKICDRCGKRLKSWEDEIASGRLELTHSSVIGDIFSEGAEKVDLDSKRLYFENHKAVKFGNNLHQSLILSYGNDDTNYSLCWSCSREFIFLLGKFFTVLE